MSLSTLHQSRRALIAALASGVGGVTLAVLAVISPHETATLVPWGLMLWGAPISFLAGMVVGTLIWWLTKSLLQLEGTQSWPVRMVLCLVPGLVGASIGYASLASAQSAPAAAAVGGLLGTLCAAMEAAAAGKTS